MLNALKTCRCGKLFCCFRHHLTLTKNAIIAHPVFEQAHSNRQSDSPGIAYPAVTNPASLDGDVPPIIVSVILEHATEAHVLYRRRNCIVLAGWHLELSIHLHR